MSTAAIDSPSKGVPSASSFSFRGEHSRVSSMVEIRDHIRHFAPIESGPGDVLLLHSIQHCRAVAPKRGDDRDRIKVSLEFVQVGSAACWIKMTRATAFRDKHLMSSLGVP